MYLIDTNKGRKADSGVRAFFRGIVKDGVLVFVSVVTIGELRRGIEKIKHRNDKRQAQRLELWLDTVLEEYGDHVLNFDQQAAQVWGLFTGAKP